MSNKMTDFKEVRVLVVEDSPSMNSLICSIAESLGATALAALNGEDAREFFECSLNGFPNLVILDVNLPGIDGYEVAKYIAKKIGNKYIPIIFVTGSNAPEVYDKCLTLGADYIPKPFSIDMMVAKLKSHLRIQQLSERMEVQNLELQNHKNSVETEFQIVKNIFSNHIERNDIYTEDKYLRYHMSPASVFNGDVFIAEKSPTGSSYYMVADVTGHGLPAAIGSLPVYAAFRTMAGKGLSIGAIAREINKLLHDILPDNMMMATIIVELNASGDAISVWSGGMPDMIITDGHSNIVSLIKSQHPPLAMMEDYEFSQDVQVLSVATGDIVYLFTDGIEEALNQSGELFTEERFHALFSGDGEDIFTRIVTELDEFAGGREQDDDITLVQIGCQPSIDASDNQKDPARDNFHVMPWKFSLSLSPDDMRAGEPIPQIVKLLSNAAGVRVHQDYISTILSEFYSNALEHGLLALPSNMKKTEDGFMDYYMLRKERLKALVEGSIEISIEFKAEGDFGVVIMTITDSGDGFDVSSLSSSSENSFGRGVSITDELCDTVDYENNGSKVIATYRIMRS